MKRHFRLQGGLIILLLAAGLITACNATETATQGVHTWLLVTAPERPLPRNKPLDVKSRTQDTVNLVSHVELYAVQLPSGEANVLIRSDPAPFPQTVFTASQVFIPTQPGHYVIKVVGYNKLGQSQESDYLGFDVE